MVKKKQDFSIHFTVIQRFSFNSSLSATTVTNVSGPSNAIVVCFSALTFVGFAISVRAVEHSRTSLHKKSTAEQQIVTLSPN